jgi:hypothetical protein
MSAEHKPCPAGCGRLSRLPVRYRAKTALCRECYDARRAAHTAHWLELRSKRGRPPVQSIRDDIPAAEIDRLFTLALAEIRRRRTCPAPTPRS